VYTWWFRPWEPIMGRVSSGEAYEITGVLFTARTVFAFALGVLLGAVLRRTVPAMLATAVVWLAVAWPSVVHLRPLIEKPLSAPADSNAISAGGWTIANWYQDSAGHHLSSSGMYHLLAQARASGVITGNQFQAFLARRGYSLWTSYQPNDRFWHFQIIEGSLYLAAALLVAGLAVWWVRRRAT
jgi:hypothetical protein